MLNHRLRMMPAVKVMNLSILSTLIRRRHSALTLLSRRALREMPTSELQDTIRFLCANVMMADDTTLCRILGRYKMLVDKADVGFSSHIMLDGFWQIWATRAILRTVREGMSVVDVGANVGYYTLLLADLVGDSGHVYAIEPNLRGMQLLQQSVAMNGFAGRVSLHRNSSPTPAKGPAIRSLNATVARRTTFARTSGAKPALAVFRGPEQKSLCLDDVIQDERLDFVKINGKGPERDVWHGMRRILARQQPLAVVMDFTVDYHRDPDVFLADMAAARFKLARVDASGNIIGVSAEEILAFPPSASQTLSLSR